MTILLFTLIAWVVIITFFIIPKGFSIIENIIGFFCITILVINVFTIITLDLKLIENSKKPEMYISLLIHRNIIIPLSILIFVNWSTALKKRFIKLSSPIITLFILVFIEKLALWTGIKDYLNWSMYYDTVIILINLSLATFIMKWLKQIE